METRDILHCTAKLSQLLSHFQSVIILSRFLVFKVPTLSYLLRKYLTRALKRRRQWGRGVIFFYYCAQFSAKLLRDDIALQFFAKNLTQTGPFTVLYKRHQSNKGTEGSMVSGTVYIRTVSSWRLLSALFMAFLGRAACIVHSISAQTSQKGIKCTKSKSLLPSYVYTVVSGLITMYYHSLY